MEVVGHSRISLTMNLYGHVYEQVEKQLTDSMDWALTGNDQVPRQPFFRV